MGTNGCYTAVDLTYVATDTTEYIIGGFTGSS